MKLNAYFVYYDMRNKHIIEPGRQYGEFTAIRSLMHTCKKGGTEKRWECMDATGQIGYYRARFLTTRLPVDQVQKTIQDEINNLVKNNMHQLGSRRRFYDEYKRNAKSRRINFKLTFNQFNSLIIQNCYYCGNEPVNTGRWDKIENKRHPKLKHNGVDRIISKEGYTVDNTVPCCSKCNLMKHVFETDDFMNHISKIFYFNKKGSTTIPQGSTSQANGDGNGISPVKESDIV